MASPSLESPDGSVSELFKYKVTLSKDSTLQWEPPAGSDELAIALSYHFPLEKGVEKKMQAATREFFKRKTRTLSETAKSIEDLPHSAKDDPRSTPDSSNPISLISRKPPFYETVKRGEQLSKPGDSTTGVRSGVLEQPSILTPASNANELRIVKWDPKSQRCKQQGRKRPYLEEEKAKVTDNRGFVCDRHRRQKKKVLGITVPQLLPIANQARSVIQRSAL